MLKCCRYFLQKELTFLVSLFVIIIFLFIYYIVIWCLLTLLYYYGMVLMTWKWGFAAFISILILALTAQLLCVNHLTYVVYI